MGKPLQMQKGKHSFQKRRTGRFAPRLLRLSFDVCPDGLTTCATATPCGDINSCCRMYVTNPVISTRFMSGSTSWMWRTIAFQCPDLASSRCCLTCKGSRFGSWHMTGRRSHTYGILRYASVSLQKQDRPCCALETKFTQANCPISATGHVTGSNNLFVCLISEEYQH